ncbi:MAG: inosine-5-monophosphate dehydrogenase [Betaproteobacteria bacterium]|jgi:CBS domain-containing protein|nr:inosine-5-monophosphate dehydrogenase [Betaproteobacteria bacterium]
MSHRPISTIIQNHPFLTVPSSTSVYDAARLMKENGMDALLVCDKRRLVGVLTERDIVFRVTAEARNAATTLIAEVMTSDPQTIPPDKPIGHALHMMYEGGFRHVPVVENGRPVGMVSTRDALGPELKAFVSEMDEREHLAEILG